jgi:hypothetical protein
MTFGDLTMVMIYVAMFGSARQVDKRTAARIWQMLVAGHLVIGI